MGKPCLTNLVSSYDEVTLLMDEGKVVNVGFLDPRKVFDTVPHSMDELWDEEVHSALDEDLAEGQSPEGCSTWGYSSLVARHQRTLALSDLEKRRLRGNFSFCTAS